ncbi:MAG: ATP-binding protein [Pseudomonadota bacterium]|nr:ATP-binding protein [Pseudomonadota bacterium]
MPTLHLICGLPGSGKSTLAARLAGREGTVWLSPDQWMMRIVGDPYDARRRAAVEQVQWELAQQLLRLGIDVVLDNGFWSRSERDRLREAAGQLGARTKLHFLDVPLPELARRVAARNEASPPGAIAISEEDLAAWAGLFEPPGPDELASGT